MRRVVHKYAIKFGCEPINLVLAHIIVSQSIRSRHLKVRNMTCVSLSRKHWSGWIGSPLDRRRGGPAILLGGCENEIGNQCRGKRISLKGTALRFKL